MRRWARAGLIGLAFLSGCGTLVVTPRERDSSNLLRSLEKATQKGNVGSVEGYLYLMQPGVPTPLRDWPVTLIPLPPTLEAAVTHAREQFASAGRVPLSADALRLARQPILDYIKEVEALGHRELIREVKTEKTEPKFTFPAVPQGRWLLLAGLPSKISVLLWAVPVTVTKGEVARQSLNDKTIWLEGLVP